jgi:NTE family protein
MELCMALGGGGARGISHLGVLHVLIEEGYQIKAMAGTSAGGAFGALFAAGYHPQEIRRRIEGVDQAKLFGRFPTEGAALLGFSGMVDVLKGFLGERTFDELDFPFLVTAVDIKTGKEVYLRSGRVIDALLATMAIPGIFPPRPLYDMLLVDGGVVGSVPVQAARQLAPFLPVIAVVLSQPTEQGIQVRSPLDWMEQNPILQPLIRLRVAQAFNIFLEAMEIGGNAMTDLRLKLEKPDVIIRPDVKHLGALDAVDINDTFRRGEQAARLLLPNIRRSTGPLHDIQRCINYSHLTPL